MSVRVMTRSGGFRSPAPAGLLALLLLSGCCSRLQQASPGAKDVCLRLSSLGEKPGGFRCGYDAVRQMSRYYSHKLDDDGIRTDSLSFVEANDTVSILQCLKDNVAIPLTMKNGTVEELLGSTSSGDPVIVFLPGDAFAVRWLSLIRSTFMLHCIVVVGHSEQGTELFFYSDGEGPYAINREAFTKQWARVDNLCIERAR